MSQNTFLGLENGAGWSGSLGNFTPLSPLTFSPAQFSNRKKKLGFFAWNQLTWSNLLQTPYFCSWRKRSGRETRRSHSRIIGIFSFHWMNSSDFLICLKMIWDFGKQGVVEWKAWKFHFQIFFATYFLIHIFR